MGKFSEASTISQLSQILGLVAVMMALFGAAFIALADQKIDAKYATDADLLAVQQTTETAVFEIKTAVEANTATVASTARSVDGLVLSILDVQIANADEEIAALESDKRAEAAAWNERDERNLRDRQKALSDLTVQRDALFARLIAPGSAQ